MKDIEDMFDEKKLKKSVKKAKIKSAIRIAIIAIGVFVIGGLLNIIISLKLSAINFERMETNVKLSMPNGYISYSNDIVGFLGGSGRYKISKEIGGKSVVLSDRDVLFGLIPPMNYFRSRSGAYHNAGEWPVSLWESGYKRLRFFHPELEYKKYQNDLENIDDITDGKVIEMAISFDKPYKVDDIYSITSTLEPADIKWIWLNEFTEEFIDEYKYAIDNYDAEANGINEGEAIGISVRDISTFSKTSYDSYYDELIDNLKKSGSSDYKKLYDEIMERGKTSVDDAEILGVVVQGTKEELKELIGKPIIKATSFGVVVDPLY